MAVSMMTGEWVWMLDGQWRMLEWSDDVEEEEAKETKQMLSTL
jgi:hypothetical protein